MGGRLHGRVTEILVDRGVQDQSLGLALLGYVADAMGNRAGHLSARKLLAMNADGAGVVLVSPGNSSQDFGTSGPH